MQAVKIIHRLIMWQRNNYETVYHTTTLKAVTKNMELLL